MFTLKIIKLGVLISSIMLIITCTNSVEIQHQFKESMKNKILSLKYEKNIEKKITKK